jgi:integrase
MTIGTSEQSTAPTDPPPVVPVPTPPAVAGTVKQAARFRFTPGAIERLRVGDGERQSVFRDEEVRGFGVIVGRAGKSWFVERRIGSAGAPVKRTIDTTDKMPLTEARKMAQRWLMMMRDGTDPHQQRRDADAKRKADAAERERRAVTLQNVLDDHCKRDDLRPVTKDNYTGDVKRHFSDWADKPIHAVTSEMVVERFRSIQATVAARQAKRAKEAGEKPKPFAGQASANNVFRTLGTLFNHAIVREWIDKSPVPILKRAKMLFPKRSRNDQIKPLEYPHWFASLEAVRGSGRPIDRVATDAFEFILFTGLRESTAFSLRWDWIDWNNKVLTVPPTGHKTGKNDDTDESKARRIMLCDRHLQILGRRRAEVPASSPWVFPSTRDSAKPIVEVRSVIKRMMNAGSPKFSEQPLRRSLGIAGRMAGVGHVQVKRLLGHAIDKTDVTEAHYTGVLDDPELRESMERAVAKIIEMSKPPTQPLRLTHVA